MSKKYGVGLGVTALVIVISFAVFFLNRGKTAAPQSPSVSGQKEEEKETFLDESGFSFNYPKSVTVSDETPDDDAYYSLLEVTKDNNPKGISITLRDTKFDNLDKWVKSGKDIPSDAALVGATSFAGFSAKQYTTDNKLWTAAIDKGVLYLIEAQKDADFWEKTNDLIVSTFALVQPKAATEKTGGGAAGGGNVVYEVEEVIE